MTDVAAAAGFPVSNPLVATLLGAGRCTPDKIAVHHDTGPWTYRRVEECSARLAHVLVRDHGVSRGARVAVQVAPTPAVVALNVACARVGAIYVPLNPAYTDHEVRDLLEVAAPALLVREASLASAVVQVTLEELLAASAAHPSTFDDEPTDESTPAAILFTSGTTGRPKGAVLTQGNLVFGCTTLNRAWGITSHDVLVHVLPLFHVHGLFVAAYCTLSSGASMHLLGSFDVDRVLVSLGESTLLMGVPTHYTRLLGDPRFDRAAAAAIRLFISGSAPMLISTHEEFFARTGQWVLERYGMTETGMITSNPWRGERRIGTVGPALPGVEVRLSGGSPGVVEVRGPNVFAGYWNRPDLRATDFSADGFFRTGDVGVLDPDGYLEIVGREKDLIITGGLNVYPKELELVLDALPGVEESAVVGVPDADFGEAVCAVVVARPGITLDGAALRARARESLAPFKVPKHVIVVDSLPRNAMGKVQKAQIRRDLASRMAP